MAHLIIEEDVRSHRPDFALLDTAEEEGIVHPDGPTA
jgi:hypothetical protein